MKKLAQIMFIVSSLSVISIYPKKIKQSESEKLGQQVIRELGDNIKQANGVFKAAVTDTEKRTALERAHDEAKILLDTLNDVKTFGNDIIRGYNPAQRRLAAITLAELLMRENSVNVEIKSVRMEIKDMTDSRSLFKSAKSGKSEQRDQAEKKIKELHTERKDVRKAIADQETILGQTWSDTIRLAINNLIVGSSYGIAYGIDWYVSGHGAKLMTTAPNKTVSSEPKTVRNNPSSITKEQKAAIKSWRHLRKNELLSQEIATAYQLTQAKELLNKLNAIKDDLRNVPLKYKYVLDQVTENSDSLARKVDRAKTRWLK
ncbi:MAG TPA: hypothetical protein VHX42_01825 [Candidatus Babeliales bacterium]|nr:hypothetical protein [Candidatus Babeliales bacterium]